jgi:glycosyltransferase involved in cell wall biosynthesis
MITKSPMAFVMYLDPLSRSIDYRPYLDSFAQTHLLRWVAHRLLASPPLHLLTVLYHYPSERAALEAMLGGLPSVELRHTEHFTRLAAAVDVARGASAVVLVRLASGFAPPSTCALAYKHHLEHGNTYTWVAGLPSGCSVSVFDSPLLEGLSEVSLSLGLTDPDQAVQRMLALAEVAGQEIPFSLRAFPINAADLFGWTSTEIPTAIPLDDELDVRFAEHALPDNASAEATSQAIDIFASYKRRLIERELEHKAVSSTQSWSLPRARSQPYAPRKILYVQGPAAFSGAEQCLCSLVRHIDRSRFRPSAVLSREGVLATSLRDQDVIVTLTHQDLTRPTVSSFRRLSVCLEEVRPDVLHVNGRHGTALLCAAAAHSVPIVQHVRTSDLGGFEEGVLASHKVIAVSQFVKSEILRFSIAAEKVSVIYDEIDTLHFSPNKDGQRAAREELGLPAGSSVAVMIARFDSYKRHDVMLQAAAIIRQRIPEFRLLVKGDVYWDCVEYERFTRLIRDLGLQEVVHWIDFIPDIRVVLTAADVLVLCSDREALGSCVAQAMSMEVPVVVTNSGGTHELVQSGSSGGYSVPSGDPNALAYWTLDLLMNPHLRRRLGQRGREFVVQNLDARRAADEVMRLYDSVIGQPVRHMEA